MPTRRGLMLAALGAGLLVAGRGFGSGPLEQLGLAIFVLPVIALFVVPLRQHDLEVTRKISAGRVRAGQDVVVTIELANRSCRRAPLLLLEDRLPLDVAGRARFAVPGLEPRGIRTTSYAVKPQRRGRYAIGPLEVSFADPFGLAQRRFVAVPEAAFLVHPKVEVLTLPPEMGERRSSSRSAVRQPVGIQGEEFYTLRDYHDGDDLRKIHWPATAKRGKYMIRQEETPWQTRTTIVIDDQAGSHAGARGAASFELAVQAAASLADLYCRCGYSYRLVGAAVPGVPTGRGAEHLHRCLDFLATAAPARAGHGDALVSRLLEIEATTSGDGTLAVVCGEPTPEAAAAIARCGRRFKQVFVIAFPPLRFGARESARADGDAAAHEALACLARNAVKALVLGPGDSLAAAWPSLSRSRSSGQRAPEPAGARR